MDMEMVPLILRLYAKVTVKIFWDTKTLYNDELWHYEAPAVFKNIFEVHTSKPDKSPPEFQAISTPAVNITFSFLLLFNRFVMSH